MRAKARRVFFVSGKKPGLVAAAETNRRKSEAGFTLVELLVVLTIMVLLTSIIAPRVIGYLGSSRVKTAKIQISSLVTSLELYKLDTGRFPTTVESLDALVAAPTGVRYWNGPYLKGRSAPVDPWGEKYFYRSPGKHGVFDIYSLGADRKPMGDGENQDIASW